MSCQKISKLLKYSFLFSFPLIIVACTKQTTVDPQPSADSSQEQLVQAHQRQVETLKAEIERLEKLVAFDPFTRVRESRNASDFVRTFSNSELQDFEKLYKQSIWFPEYTFEEYLKVTYLVSDMVMQSALNEPNGLVSMELPAHYGITEAYVRNSISEELEPTESEIRAVYEEFKNENSAPPKVRIRLILVQTEADADKIVTDLRAGSDFGQLAMENSQHTSRDSGGNIEPFERGTYQPELEDTAFSMSPGEIAKVKTDRGVFVIQKISTIENQIPTLEEERDRIYRQLKEEKKRVALQSFAQQLNL